jgi:hypothetical protein
MLRQIIGYSCMIQLWLVVNMTNRWYNVVSDVYQEIFFLLGNAPEFLMFSTSMFDWFTVGYKRKVIDSLFINTRSARLLQSFAKLKYSDENILYTFFGLITNTLTIPKASEFETRMMLFNMLGYENFDSYVNSETSSLTSNFVLNTYQLISGQNINDSLLKTTACIEAHLSRIPAELLEISKLAFNMEVIFLILFTLTITLAWSYENIFSIMPKRIAIACSTTKSEISSLKSCTKFLGIEGQVNIRNESISLKEAS